MLSEEEEARLGYVAAINTSTLTDGGVLEIGGGSLQLVGVRDRRAQTLSSLPLGAVRLTEEFLPGDGPARRRRRSTRSARTSARRSPDLPWLGESGHRLVGIGGAVRNLAAAIQHEHEQLFDIGVQGFVIRPDPLAELIDRLASMPAAERATYPASSPAAATSCSPPR